MSDEPVVNLKTDEALSVAEAVLALFRRRQMLIVHPRYSARAERALSDFDIEGIEVRTSVLVEPGKAYIVAVP